MAINETENAVTGVINPDSGIYLFSMHNGIVDRHCKFTGCLKKKGNLTLVHYCECISSKMGIIFRYYETAEF